MQLFFCKTDFSNSFSVTKDDREVVIEATFLGLWVTISILKK